MLKRITLGAIALALAASAESQQLPAIRQLGPVVATSKETFGQNVSVRPLKGAVLVNDVQNRRLLMFDASLASFTVVADSTPATATAYSGRVAGLIAYRADSSLFVDPASSSMLVIDPAGKIQRVMSVPRSQDAIALGSGMFGTPALDASGRLVYRGFPRPQFRAAGPGGGFTPPEPPDSIPVIRVDLTSRQMDTVGFTKVPKPKMDVQRDDNGRVSVTMTMNPLPVVDEWAVLSDGSVALLRGRDYHVDWVRPDGTRESSPKMPFEWQRMTDEDKVAFMDSLKAARQRMAANAPAATANAPAGGAGGGGGGAGGAGGEGRMTIMIGPGGAEGGRGAGPGGMGMGREPTFVAPSELPDYKPPFFAGPGSVRADADGHLWVRTIPTKGVAGGPVYDVINTKGELVERVQVPKDRLIVGFGAGGVVYLLARESGATTTKLERATVR
jgi:hypothetical protein